MPTIEVKERYQQEYSPIVRSGGQLRISYYSNKGRYNLLSNDESTKCHISIYEGDKRIAGTSIDVEDEYDGNDVDEIVWLIDQDDKTHLVDTARPKKQAVRNFIIRNQARIELGNAKHDIERLNNQINNMVAERDSLIKFLAEAEQAEAEVQLNIETLTNYKEN